MNTKTKKFDVREVVSDNVKRLMAYHVDLGTIQKVSKRSGVPTGTVDRVKRGLTHCRIDILDAMASAFELHAWHLLIPNLDPSNPPVYLSEKERELYSRMADVARELPGAKPDMTSTGQFAPLPRKR